MRAPRAFSRDLAYEIAAVSAAILDAREEKTNTAKRLNLRIRELEKRQSELINAIRTGGTQLAINFGSKVVEVLDAVVDEEDERHRGHRFRRVSTGRCDRS